MRDRSLAGTRRKFLAAGAGLAGAQLSAVQSTPSALTGGTVIERIKTNVGIPWRPQTVDNIIARAVGLPVLPISSNSIS